MVAVTLGIYALFPGAPMTLDELWAPAGAALTQAYSIYAASEAGPSSPFAVTWSLSVEWMFYLLWPIAVYIAKKRGSSAKNLALLAAAVALLMYAGSMFQTEHWFYYGPLARVPEILAGGVLALCLTTRQANTKKSFGSKLDVVLALSSVMALAAYTLFGPVQWSDLFRFVGLPLTVVATLYLIFLGARSPANVVVKALSWGPLTFVGRISYSLYLWHFVGNNVLTRENLNLPLPAIGIVGIVFTLAMTALSYRFLELPFLRSKRDALASKVGVDSPETASVKDPA